MPKKFEIISSEIVYQDKYRTFKKLNILRNGQPGVYTYMTGNNFVMVVPLSPTRRTLLLRQFRFPINQEQWELCAGTMDPGETPMQTATRELFEETGLKASRVTQIGHGLRNAGISDARVTFFVADVTDADLDAVKVPDDMDEITDLRVLPLAEVDAMVDRGELVCGGSFMALYHLHRYLKKQHG